MLKNVVIALVLTVLVTHDAAAQFSVSQQGEVGLTAGAANYFGDLNTNASFSHPKIALGAYYLRQYNGYLDLRISMHYAQLGYSDRYSHNNFQQRRNLSFNTDIVEIAAQADFNFFKFEPSVQEHAFTPFVSIGIGAFTYNPYAYLNNEKVYLRPLGTEGQNMHYVGPDGKERKPYGSTAICFPIGFGVKYAVNSRWNVTFQVVQRLTTTDYIDDVSTTYVGLNPDGTSKFTPLPNGQPSPAQLLQDRSYATGAPIGTIPGAQRGWSKQKDQYMIAEIGFSFNLRPYICPAL